MSEELELDPQEVCECKSHRKVVEKIDIETIRPQVELEFSHRKYHELPKEVIAPRKRRGRPPKVKPKELEEMEK